jgi:peptide/nickel transport system permease protein
VVTAIDNKPRPLFFRLALAALRTLLFFAVVDAVTFALFDLLPDSVLVQVGIMGVDPRLLAEARDKLGVSGPWYERYAMHWYNLAHADFGKTLVGGFPIGPLFRDRLAVSAPLWLGTLLVLVAVPVPLAFATTSRRASGVWQKTLDVLAPVAAAPSFLTAVVVSAVWVLFLAELSSFSGAVRWVLAVISCAALPAGVALSASLNSYRSSMQARFVQTYRMMGLSEHRIKVLLLRNVLLLLRPLLARLALGVLTGTVFAEIAFDQKGVGYLFVEALRTSDLNVMRTWVLFSGWIVLVLTEGERL